MPKVVTANALSTGKVVFLGRAGGWVGAIAEARLFEDAASADAGLAEANDDSARSIIVEPFVIEAGAAETGGRPKMTLRDTIRAYGPTIEYLSSGAKTA